IQQVAPPQRVYASPANRFVAEFVGLANLLSATVREVGDGHVNVRAAGQDLTARLPDERRPEIGDTGTVMVRPEQVVLAPVNSSIHDGSWGAQAVVVEHGFFGAYERYWLEVEGVEERWMVDVALRPGAALGLAESGFDAASGLRERTGSLTVGEDVTLWLRPGSASWLW